MVDHVSSSKRSEIMAAVRSKETRPELAVRKLLHALGYRYRLHDANLPGKPDIVLKSRKKIIFVHGCFWHRHLNCKHATFPKTRKKFWNEKFAKNVIRDVKVQAELLDMGWKTLIVWQCELKNAESLSKRIVDFLEESNGKKNNRTRKK